MKQLVYHIMYRFAGIILGMLAVAQAAAQKPVQHFEVDQCEFIDFSVVEFTGDRYTWDLYTDPTVNFAQKQGDLDPAIYFENGMYQGSTVRVIGLDPGWYFLRVMVWDEVNCTNNLLVFSLEVIEQLPTADLEADPFCYGDVNEVRVILTGRGPWTVTYTYDHETNQKTVNLNGETNLHYLGIPNLSPGAYQFWIMEVTDQCTVRSYPDPEKTEVLIYPSPSTSRIYVKPEEDEEQNP
jgi:hypothetical protein